MKNKAQAYRKGAHKQSSDDVKGMNKVTKPYKFIPIKIDPKTVEFIAMTRYLTLQLFKIFE